MSTVEEIERAIEQLPPQNLARLAGWLLKRDNDAWDKQMAEDAEAGRLDFLFDEAQAERNTGLLRDALYREWQKAFNRT